MKVKLISIPVLDQEKALAFYTEKLDFLVTKNIELGGGNRWITLVSKDWQDGPELLLEPGPLHFEPSKVFQEALFNAGIPYTQFEVDSVDESYQTLLNKGVEFSVTPAVIENTKYAIFNDTSGNFIQIVETLFGES